MTEEDLKVKLDSTIFIGMDIATQVSNLIKIKESVVTKDMFPGEQEAYRLGVDNCISLLMQLLETDSDNEFVVQVGSMGDRQEEFMFRELVDKSEITDEWVTVDEKWFKSIVNDTN